MQKSNSQGNILVSQKKRLFKRKQKVRGARQEVEVEKYVVCGCGASAAWCGGKGE